jgi:uncharacterized protein with HEPN domain
VRVEDILEAIDRIESYTHGLTFEDFGSDSKTVDAVVRNLEVVGEAARNLESEVTAKLADVPWPDVRDMRNVLVHEYFGVDRAIVWATVKQDLPPLATALRTLLEG